jgi:PGF-pre-PGF domain-containing protein
VSVERWTAALYAESGAWRVADGWSLGLKTKAKWTRAELWPSAVHAPRVWRAIEKWPGLIAPVTKWSKAEAWSGAMSAYKPVWHLSENWAAAVHAPRRWVAVDKLWYAGIHAGDFKISISPSSGEAKPGRSVSATVSLTPIGVYNYTVELSASGAPGSVTFSPVSGVPPFDSTMSISVARTAQPGTYTITVTAKGADGTTHSTSFILKVVELKPPTSMVQPITPYWQTKIPLKITASASDPDGGVVAVELHYRYSRDNANWGAWTLFAEDRDGSDGWSWMFTADNGDGFYEFYSVARDSDGLREEAPAEADARCAVDTAPPAAPELISPPDHQVLLTGTVEFDWGEVSDISGVTYELQVSTSPLFATVTVEKSVRTPRASLLDNEALAEDVYFWRVRAVDGVGHRSDWSQVRSFIIAPDVPVAPLVLAEDGRTAEADFAKQRIFIVRVVLQLSEPVDEGRLWSTQIMIEEYAEAPEGVSLPAGIVYRYFGLVSGTLEPRIIENVRIEFRIDKRWSENENLLENTVRLLYWTGSEWFALETRFVAEDNDFLYFVAASPRLALFAAVGERRTAPLPGELPPEAPVVLLPPVWTLALLTIAAAAGAIGVHVYLSVTRRQRMLRKLERAVLRPPRRRLGRPVRPVVPPARPLEVEMIKRLRRIAKEKRRRARSKSSE